MYEQGKAENNTAVKHTQKEIVDYSRLKKKELRKEKSNRPKIQTNRHF